MQNQNQHVKSSVISSLFWKFMERGGTQGIQFIVQIVLARLLMPEEYGIIAIVNVFILLANVFVQSGLNTALIQKKDADETDFSSVFYISMIIAGILYVLLYFGSPIIASFYRNQQLVPVIRVLSLILFLGAVNSIQNAFVAKAMIFKKLFFSSLWAIVISGAAGIGLAYIGWGVWALVVQQLLNQLIITIILWFLVTWRPKLLFSIEKVKTLVSYGWRLLASSLLNTLYMDFRTLVIGRVFNAGTLGYYNKGRQFPQVLVTNINGSIQSVMLPALSLYQDDKKRVREMMKIAIATSTFLIFPMMVGLGIIAEPLIKLVLTEKWLPAVFFLQVYCIIFALRPIHTTNVQSINALGRSDIFLGMEILRSIIGIAVLFITVPLGVYAIAIGELICTFISTYIYCFPNKKLIDYSFFDQLKDITPAAFLSITMGVAAYATGEVVPQMVIKIVLQILVGVLTYFLLAKIFKVKSYLYLKNTAYTLFRMKFRKS